MLLLRMRRAEEAAAVFKDLMNKARILCSSSTTTAVPAPLVLLVDLSHPRLHVAQLPLASETAVALSPPSIRRNA